MPLFSHSHIDGLSATLHELATRDVRSLFFFEPREKLGFGIAIPENGQRLNVAAQKSAIRALMIKRLRMHKNGTSVCRVVEFKERATGFAAVDMLTAHEGALCYIFADRDLSGRPAGSATAAVRAVLRDAFRRNAKLHRVYGIVSGVNGKSIRLLKRAQFRRVEMPHDHWVSINQAELTAVSTQTRDARGTPFVALSSWHAFVVDRPPDVRSVSEVT